MIKLNIVFNITNYLVNTRMRIKQDVGKGQLCTRGEVLGIFGGGVPPGSVNPDPISDQNIMVKIYIRFQTRTVQKHTLWGGTYLYN